MGSIDRWAGLIFGMTRDDAIGWREIEARTRHLASLEGMVARLLESYQSNVALDFISAGVRLLRGEYDHPDGSERIMAHFRREPLAPPEAQSLQSFLLTIAERADARGREAVARDLMHVFPTRDSALAVYERLGVDTALQTYFARVAEAAGASTEGIEYGLAGG